MANIFRNCDPKYWVDSKGVMILLDIFNEDFKEYKLSEAEFKEMVKDFLEKYEASDDADFGTILTDTLKELIRKRAEIDVMDEINKFQTKLDELKDRLGNRTIEQVYANPEAKTDLEKMSSIRKAFMGILLMSYVDKIEYIIDDARCRLEKHNGYDPFEMFNARIVMDVLKKNDYKYGDVDLNELRGKTFEDLLDSEKLEKENVDCDVLRDKLMECLCAIYEHIRNSFDGIMKTSSSINEYDFVNMYFKNEIINEIESKFGNIVAGLKHVEPNEGKKEVEWTEDELKLKEEIDKSEDGE